jgi:AbrB family looped-hinge helix DNA binding protein
MKKGICVKERIVYGIAKVSDKGQIAIPQDLRNCLNINQGDSLMVLKRKDESGFTLIKLDKMDDLVYKLQEDEGFFNKIKGGSKMSKCKECQFYAPVDETKGNCFGHEVSGDQDANQCPSKAFKPREKKSQKKKG